MALDLDDFEKIRTLFKEESKELHEQISTELKLNIEPIKDTLTAHIKHDEKQDEINNKVLSDLKEGAI